MKRNHSDYGIKKTIQKRTQRNIITECVAIAIELDTQTKQTTSSAMPPLLTRFSCEKEIGQVEEGKDEHNMIANIMTRSQVDDETEIARNPIAGEHDSDYDTDSNDEIEEEGDSDLLQNNVPVESSAVTGVV
jgi:hypothetical protein